MEDTAPLPEERTQAVPAATGLHWTAPAGLVARVRDVPPSVPAVVLVVLLGLLLVPNFLSSDNLIGLAPQIAALAVLTVGQTFVLLVRGLDLSVSAVVAAAAVLLSGAVYGPVWQRILAVAVVAVGTGVLNGFLVTKRRVPAFIATFGTLVFVGGLELGITGGQTSGTAPSWMVTLGVGRVGFMPWSVLVAVAVFAVAAVVLRRSAFGRAIYAIGSNPEAARYTGIAVDQVTIICFIVCSSLAVLAGVMMAGFAEYIDNTLGTDANLNSIAAAIIGGVAFSGGRGTLTGTLAGVIVMMVTINLLILSGFDVQWRYIMQGLILIAAVAIQRFQQQRADA